MIDKLNYFIKVAWLGVKFCFFLSLLFISITVLCSIFRVLIDEIRDRRI